VTWRDSGLQVVVIVDGREALGGADRRPGTRQTCQRLEAQQHGDAIGKGGGGSVQVGGWETGRTGGCSITTSRAWRPGMRGSFTVTDPVTCCQRGSAAMANALPWGNLLRPPQFRVRQKVSCGLGTTPVMGIFHGSVLSFCW